MLINKAARRSSGSKIKWTYREDEALVKFHQTKSNKELSQALGKKEDGTAKRTSNSVMYRVNKLYEYMEAGTIKDLDDLKAFHIKKGTCNTEKIDEITEDDFE